MTLFNNWPFVCLPPSFLFFFSFGKKNVFFEVFYFISFRYTISYHHFARITLTSTLTHLHRSTPICPTFSSITTLHFMGHPSIQCIIASLCYLTKAKTCNLNFHLFPSFLFTLSFQNLAISTLPTTALLPNASPFAAGYGEGYTYLDIY
ncbi:hypothetical protein VNO77_24563 [Canavalia gladiata]|uniref:Uncharacterized protein n=1 Tax=Canavalia gladiata TaxID=3824 RepID=A0AAN9L6J3_CANGL